MDNLEKFNTDNFVMYKTQDGLTQIEYFITARDNKNYKNAFYNLEAILAVAFRVRSNRGVQFRKQS